MNLRWNELEKPLRARLKCHDARSKMTLWQRVVHFFSVDPKSRAGVDPLWVSLSRALATVILIAVALYHSEYLAAHPGVVISGIGIWGLAATIFRAGIIRGAAHGNAEYRSLWMFPLTADQIYRHWWAQLYVGSVCLFFESLCAYGIVAFSQPQSLRGLLLTLPCTALQVALSSAFALLLVRLKSKTDWLFLTVVIYLYAYVVFWIPQLSSGNHAAVVVVFSQCNPMEWLGGFYLHGWIQGEPQAWWRLLPALVVSMTLPASLRRFHEMHHNGAFRHVSASRALPFRDVEPITPPSPQDTAGLRDKLLNEDFLQPLPWNARGPLERLLSFVLSPGEIRIAETLLISPPKWLKRVLVFVALLFLFRGIHTFAKSANLQDLAARSSWRTLEAYVLIFGDRTIFFLRGFYAFSLFSWPRDPTLPQFLLPLSGFKIWKTSVKINAVLLTLIVPLTLVISSSAFVVSAGVDGVFGLGFLARALTLALSCSFIGTWTVSIYRLGPLNRGPSLMLLTLVTIMLPTLGLFWVLFPMRTFDWLVAPLLILGSLGWSFICGKLELQAWRNAAVKMG